MICGSNITIFTMPYHLDQSTVTTDNCELHWSLKFVFFPAFPFSLHPFFLPSSRPHKPLFSAPCQTLCWALGHRDDNTLPPRELLGSVGNGEIDKGIV